MKSLVPVSEFFKWIEYEDREWNHHSKLDHYLAQIAYEVFQLRWVVMFMFSKERQTHGLDLKSFFIQFTSKPEEMVKVEVAERKEENPQELRDRKAAVARMSKSKWLPFTGINPSQVA